MDSENWDAVNCRHCGREFTIPENTRDYQPFVCPHCQKDGIPTKRRAGYRKPSWIAPYLPGLVILATIALTLYGWHNVPDNDLGVGLGTTFTFAVVGAYFAGWMCAIHRDEVDK